MKNPETKRKKMGGGEGAWALLPQKEYILYKFAICALGTEKRREVRVGGDEGYYFQEKLYKTPRPRLKTPKYTKTQKTQTTGTTKSF